jgi:cytochrome c oxidase subunit 2
MTASDLPIPSIFAPVSTPAFMIRDLSWLVLAVCAVIFAVVAYLLVHVIVRFRAPRADDHEPPQVYGSNAIELAWTVVPVLLVLVLFLSTARTIFEIERARPADALRVTVVGHQWWWEFRYPDLGIVTANELHLPVSDGAGVRRPTMLRLESVDVIHSFWLPQLNGKTDVIPNHPNTMWVEPLQVGTYYGQCAEYCGTQHAHMLIRVVVHSRAEFDAWATAQRALPAESTSAGRAVFLATACVNCHAVRGTPAVGSFGPDLTHLMSRATIGAGAAPNTRENLRRWVNNPDHLKPGVLMPAMNLPDDQVDAVVAYLMTLK